ncbi:DUF5565 family protein [Micromonospora zamorensis]
MLCGAGDQRLPDRRGRRACARSRPCSSATRTTCAGATYELVGPKVNGNPEQVAGHQLIRHGFCTSGDDDELEKAPLDHDGLRAWLLAHPDWEGVVWHHPDGRMGKLKRRDFSL